MLWTKSKSALVAGVMAAGLAVTGCGSSSKSTSATTNTSGAVSSTIGAAGTKVKAAAGAPILLETDVPLSGGESLADVVDGAKIAAKAIDASGGVGGRPIDIVSCDMQLSPTGSAACGREAVSKKVLAVVGSQDAFGSYVSYIKAAGIPTIGNCSVCNQADGAYKLAFPTTTGGASTVSLGEVAGLLGAKHVTEALFNGAAGKEISGAVGVGLSKFGLKASNEQFIPTTAGDLSPYVANLTSGDAIILVCQPATTVSLIRAIAQTGYKGKVITSDALVTQSDVTQLGSAASTLYIVGESVPPTDKGAPGVAAFTKEAAAYGSLGSVSPDAYMVETWAEVHVIANLLGKTTTVSSAALVKAMTAAGPIDYPPVVPWNWSTPSPLGGYTNDVFLLHVNDGVLSPVTTNLINAVSPPKSLPSA